MDTNLQLNYSENEVRLKGLTDEFLNPASYFWNGFSSILNEVSEVHEFERGSNILASSKMESMVCKPRISTIANERQVWTIEEDEILLITIKKNQSRGMPLNWSKVAKEVNEYRSLLYNKDSSDCQKRFHELNKKTDKNDVWTEKEVQECLKLHRKYGPNWKIISKKMPSKTDKQIMYKVNSIIKDSKSTFWPPQNDENKIRNSDHLMEVNKSNDFDCDIVKKTSGEQFKEMLSIKNSEYSYDSSSSNPKFKIYHQSAMDGSMGVIQEEHFAYNDFSVNDSDF